LLLRSKSEEDAKLLQVMGFVVEIDREEDGRFIADVPALPGVLAYGATRDEALANVKALALRVIADKVEHGESVPLADQLFAAA
jgi:predicted RNase H-like HicB family nuclease